jgi:hypothetical protein
MVILLTGTSCSSGDGPSPRASPKGTVPIVTPTSAYAPFPYTNAGQRRAFDAFLACAADHGLEYQGPFTDSTGKSLFLRLGPGEKASRAAQEEVNADCPQNTVGLFGTPVGPVDANLFERAAKEFARCIRSHGYPSYPLPGFGDGEDPVDAFWQLPFDWSSARFIAATKACVEPLRSYLFSG